MQGGSVPRSRETGAVLPFCSPTDHGLSGARPVVTWMISSRLRREADAVALGGPTAYHVVAAIAWCFGMIVVFGSLSIARYRSTT